jgi:hypothetical protein
LIDSSVLGRATLGSKQEGSRYISYNVGSIHEGEWKMEDCFWELLNRWLTAETGLYLTYTNENTIGAGTPGTTARGMETPKMPGAQEEQEGVKEHDVKKIGSGERAYTNEIEKNAIG